jgi:hypothetical protein
VTWDPGLAAYGVIGASWVVMHHYFRKERYVRENIISRFAADDKGRVYQVLWDRSKEAVVRIERMGKVNSKAVADSIADKLNHEEGLVEHASDG